MPLSERVAGFLSWAATPRGRGWLVAAGLGGVLAVASLSPSAEVLPLVCLFRRVTTVPCPSCGMTHAFVAMGHGSWAEAFRSNLAGPFWYSVCGVAFLLAAAQAASGRDLLRPAWSRLRPHTVRFVLALMGIAWGVNIIRRLGS